MKVEKYLFICLMSAFWGLLPLKVTCSNDLQEQLYKLQDPRDIQKRWTPEQQALFGHVAAWYRDVQIQRYCECALKDAGENVEIQEKPFNKHDKYRLSCACRDLGLWHSKFNSPAIASLMILALKQSGITLFEMNAPFDEWNTKTLSEIHEQEDARAKAKASEPK